MAKRYQNYNDYELLYLIKEGSERALEILFEKYEVYISKIARGFIPYGDKCEDLIQEGRIVLFSCIKRYRDDFDVSFFSFVSISIKRCFYKLIKTDYYTMPVLSEDAANINLNVMHNEHNIYTGRRFFNDEILIKLFDECIIGNTSLSYFGKKYGLSYNQVYYKYNLAISELKKFFPID